MTNNQLYEYHSKYDGILYLSIEAIIYYETIYNSDWDYIPY